MLSVLLRKKKVKRIQEGRAFRYRPCRHSSTGHRVRNRRPRQAYVRRLNRGAAHDTGRNPRDRFQGSRAPEQEWSLTPNAAMPQRRNLAKEGAGTMIERSLFEYLVNSHLAASVAGMCAAWLLIRIARPSAHPCSMRFVADRAPVCGHRFPCAALSGIRRLRQALQRLLWPSQWRPPRYPAEASDIDHMDMPLLNQTTPVASRIQRA